LFIRHLRMLSRVAGPLEQLPKKAAGSKSLTAASGQDELRGELLKLALVCRTGRCGKGNRER